MIAYATLGTNDLVRARAFYDKVLQVVGASVLWDSPAPSGGQAMLGYGRSMAEPMLIIATPHNRLPATVGNGTMIAIACRTPGEVEAVHAAAIASGGKDEGAPGPRGEAGFYCGYFRDTDGNKLNAFCMTKAGIK